nr:immunoglobulin heavy chain junction region [Macaca mulatta]
CARERRPAIGIIMIDYW